MSSTLVIIAVTCIVSIMAFSNAELVRQLILWPPAISRDKQYYRLVSYGLIHADPMHLFFNMFTLYFFGRMMEQLYNAVLGPFGFVLFYAGALVASILPTYLRNRGNSRYHSLGASGAVSATLFAFILLQPWAKILVFVVPMPAILFAVLYVVYEFWLERQGADNVNHNAHLWGAAYGVLFTIIMEPRVLILFFAQLTHP
ncbi:MAG: rhomboid family intramembrane serine protease [Xanthomonadaceae bacterium]|nr:rhomboid family intramembrane serine protease [Xanthomonadaceae bacterium]MDE2083649.1 rhomboid family intramembrane serine protease [Xanthomonadaceae bacterium]MDE2257880.1 rhomboid family intramembrane serine protease [Xanthomonadaceae bacterium]